MDRDSRGGARRPGGIRGREFGTMPREIITLSCTECKRRNYTNSRNKKTKTERLELKKYCPAERKHTLHRETK